MEPDEIAKQSSAIPYVPELDGIRGIAISLVLLFHLRVPLFGLGWCGVDLFFVLSGFLITAILLETKGSPQFFRAFYARRVLRIFPLYFFSLFAVFYVALPIAQHFGRGHGVALRDQLWFWLYLSNWRNAFGHNVYFLSHFWSLAVEEQFYLVWPLLVFLLSRRRLAVLCGVAVATCLALRIAFGMNGADPEMLQRATIFRIDTLTMGGLIALLAGNIKLTGQILSYVRFAGITGIAVLSGIVIFSGPSQLLLPMSTVGYTAIAIASAWLIFYSSVKSGSTEPVCRMLRARPLRAMGKYSYGMYVLHYPLIILILEAANRFVTEPGGRWSGTAHLIAIIAGFSASYLAAMISWNLLEKHFLRLKGRFRYEFRSARLSNMQEEAQKLGLAGNAEPISSRLW